MKGALVSIGWMTAGFISVFLLPDGSVSTSLRSAFFYIPFPALVLYSVINFRRKTFWADLPDHINLLYSVVVTYYLAGCSFLLCVRKFAEGDVGSAFAAFVVTLLFLMFLYALNFGAKVIQSYFPARKDFTKHN